MITPIRVRGVVILLALGIGCYWWSSAKHATQENQGISLKVSSVDDRQGRLISRSMFLQEYGDKNRSTLNDLESVYLLLTDCQLIFKDLDSYFLPDNRAITSFLAGGNREKLIWVPPSHSAVNSNGELLDRYGTPLFFHRISGLNFEIHSAGEDKVMWTGDDFVFPAKESSHKSE